MAYGKRNRFIMDIINITAEYLRPFLTPRRRDSHKGDYGRALIIAGSRGMTGAAVLAARAALKAGAGLVTVACPDSEQPVIACAVPEAMTLPLPSEDGAASLKAAGKVLAFQKDKKCDVCLIGPGLSLKGETPEFVRTVLKNVGIPAVIDADGQGRQAVTDLRLVYVANKVEPESRAFLFYVQLPNKLVRSQDIDGHRFSAWQFKPGQRVSLLVPVERWADRIVLPVNAVVQDGPESYVFEKNDGHFDRRSVRVEYRDQFSAVIANDGTLTPGKMVIVSGAYQVHLAMKNKAGGAPDPHAGHNH